MPAFEPRDPDYEARVRQSFAQQAMMETLGATLAGVRPGEIEISLPFDPAFAQQHGYLHAAAVTAVADSACGYAALSLMPPDREVLSVEFTVNLLAPAEGERFVARAQVVRPGRRITVCRATVSTADEEGVPEKEIAAVQATMTSVAA